MDVQHTDAPGKSQPKALKFVTNYGQPQVKRRRIGAACLTCRKRKTACSGERPTCDTCAQNRLECAGYSSETPTAPGHKRTTSENGQRTVKHEDADKLDPSLQAPSKARGRQQAPTADGLSSAETVPPGAQQDVAAADSSNGQPNESLFSGPRNRMPYFRWLGPTAIMPGFKQMVVKVKRQDTDMARSSTNGDGLSGLTGSPALNDGAGTACQGQQRLSVGVSGTPGAAEADARTPLSLPFYDTSPMPPSELITHLVQTFFTHLGCNYPFLQRERFLRDLEEKQVDAILVDAVCALAARFSTHSLLTQQSGDDSKPSPADYGHVFAQRAKTALVDTYSCPSVAAVQAALLLAYLEFGESRDSGLWMYLGISIRMAQDLGMHTLEGLRYKGRTGLTPKMIKRASVTSPEPPSKAMSEKIAEAENKNGVSRGGSAISEDHVDDAESLKDIEEQKSVEQERVDTLWAVFLLDRVVSSGTGRRCMLRDKDIEVAFPRLDQEDPKTGWPAPFPALIRIVHLYGRVADLLNSIKEPSDITTETPKRLANMESQVTNLYQGLSPKLHFDAVNFQHYMKAGEGTNFVMLHFWFHLLIVLLHQPTLLKTFEGRMLQLFPNSQQLSMSSAKTIADILSYSQLMDAKASLGNPFTSQPIYIAACAFLKETAEQTASSTQQSRATSPASTSRRREESGQPSSTSGTPAGIKRMSISELSNPNQPKSSSSDKPSAPADSASKASSGEHSSSTVSSSRQAANMAKHSLLATAATQHYQLCYKALQSLETYWSGAKYILTVLDQKFQGVGDPLLYTAEEGESSMEQPRPEPAFTSPGWRRKASWGQYLPGNVEGLQPDLWGGKDWSQLISGGGGNGDPSQAIGWTLTGTMNSASTNLAMHYPSTPGPSRANRQKRPSQPRPAFNPITNQYDPPLPPNRFGQQIRSNSNGSTSQPTSFPLQSSSAAAAANGMASTSDADLLLNLHSPYNATHSQAGSSPAFPNGFSSGGNGAAQPSNFNNLTGANWNYADLWNPVDYGLHPMGDMMIESQDVDMSMLGLDMMPWFDNFSGGEMMFGNDGRQVGGVPSGGAAQREGTPHR